MIKKKISQLPAASALDWTELIEVVQGGVNKQATTGSVSNSRKILVGELAYTGLSSDVPIITVLENAIGGTPIMSRTGAGAYRLTLTGLFPANKTVTTFGNGLSGVNLRGGRISNDVIAITTIDGLDYVLQRASVRIEVYP